MCISLKWGRHRETERQIEEPHLDHLIPETQSTKIVTIKKILCLTPTLSSSHNDQKNGQRDRKTGRQRENRRENRLLGAQSKDKHLPKRPSVLQLQESSGSAFCSTASAIVSSLLRFTTPQSENPSQLTTAITNFFLQKSPKVYRSEHRMSTNTIVSERQALPREGSRHCKERRAVMQVRYFQLKCIVSENLLGWSNV